MSNRERDGRRYPDCQHGHDLALSACPACDTMSMIAMLHAEVETCAQASVIAMTDAMRQSRREDIPAKIYAQLVTGEETLSQLQRKAFSARGAAEAFCNTSPDRRYHSPAEDLSVDEGELADVDAEEPHHAV